MQEFLEFGYCPDQKYLDEHGMIQGAPKLPDIVSFKITLKTCKSNQTHQCESDDTIN